MSQAHEMRDSIHDVDVCTMDAKTVSEVRLFVLAWCFEIEFYLKFDEFCISPFVDWAISVAFLY